MLGDSKLQRFTPAPALNWAGRRRTWWFDEQEHAFSRWAKSAGDLTAAGGRVALGSHSVLDGLGAHWELWALATGMSNLEALRIATQTSADAMGLSRELGSIETGKLADLIVLTKNPLKDTHNTTSIRYASRMAKFSRPTP